MKAYCLRISFCRNEYKRGREFLILFFVSKIFPASSLKSKVTALAFSASGCCRVIRDMLVRRAVLGTSFSWQRQKALLHAGLF
jgi:hypothetical protein